LSFKRYPAQRSVISRRPIFRKKKTVLGGVSDRLKLSTAKPLRIRTAIWVLIIIILCRYRSAYTDDRRFSGTAATVKQNGCRTRTTWCLFGQTIERTRLKIHKQPTAYKKNNKKPDLPRLKTNLRAALSYDILIGCRTTKQVEIC